MLLFQHQTKVGNHQKTSCNVQVFFMHPDPCLDHNGLNYSPQTFLPSTFKGDNIALESIRSCNQQKAVESYGCGCDFDPWLYDVGLAFT